MSAEARVLLAATAADVCVIARAPFCALSSRHGDDACVAAVQGARSHGAPPPGTRWRVSDVPPARQAVVSGRAVAVADPDDPRLTPEQRAALTGDAGLVSLAFIPLLSNGLVVGLMVLGDSRPRDLAEVAPQLGAIVRLAATVLAQDERLAEFEQRNRVLHEIVALGARVNQTTEPSGLARFVAKRLTEVVGATCCEIYKIERGELRCLVSLDVRPGYDDPAAYEPIEMSAFPSLERAAQSRDLLVFASAYDPRLTEREREIYRRWDFGSELSIPLFSDDRLVGLIDIFDQRPRDYAEHLDFARSVGRIVAGAFANLLLMERLAETNRELRLLAESSFELAASLDLRRILDATARRLCAAARVGACDLHRLRGRAGACAAVNKTAPAMGLNHIPDSARPDVFAKSPVAVGAMPLVAHHGGHLVLLRRFGQRARLGDVMAQGFLAKDVLPKLDGAHRGRRVVMIRRRDKDHIYFLVHGIEHPPVVMKSTRPSTLSRGLLRRSAEPGIVNIHDRHQTFAKAGLEAHLAPPAATNDRDGELRIGGRSRQQMGSLEHGRGSGTQGGLLEERSAANRIRAALMSRQWHETHSIKAPAARQWGMKVSKSETRKPKSEVRMQSLLGRRTVPLANARALACSFLAAANTHSRFTFHVSILVFRPSDFLRISGFGVRISGLPALVSSQSVEL